MANKGSMWIALGLALALALTQGAAPVAAPTTANIENWKRCADGDPDRSIEGCTAVIEARVGGDFMLATAFATRAAARVARGEVDLAIRDLDEAIRLNPSFVLALESRGGLHMKKQRYDRAIQDYDEAIRLNPSFADAYYSRGVNYERRGQHERAIEDFDQVLRLEPGADDARKRRCESLRALGRAAPGC